MKKSSNAKPTIEDAAVEILTILGGKAHRSKIIPYILEHVEFNGETPERSISCSLQRAKKVRASEGQRGWWELVSYQEEIAKLKAEIAHRDEVIEGKNKEIERLRSSLGVTPSFERLATALMDKLAGFDKEDKKDARTLLRQLASWLALSPCKDIMERINGFVYEKPKAGEPSVVAAIDRQTEVNKNLAEALTTLAGKPTTQNIVYPQANSTTNVGCDQKDSEFKTYLPAAGVAPVALEQREEQKKIGGQEHE